MTTDKDMKARKAAIDAGNTKYYTGIACPKGHVADRYASGGNCTECMKLHSLATNEKRRLNTDAKRRQRADDEYKLLEAERRKLKYKKGEWAATVKRRSTKAGWLKHVLTGVRHRAKLRGLEYSITAEDLHVPDVCPVLGIPLHFEPPGRKAIRCHSNLPSIDRFDNNKGYVPGNVCVISYRANALKSNASLDEIERVCAYMASGGVPSQP
jgi:hypothetical protein